MDWISPRTLSRRGILGMNRRNVQYIGGYNRRERFPLVDDKLKTKLIAQKAGLRVPKLLGVVRTQHEIEMIRDTLADHSKFAIKPSQGSGGKGILVIVDREDDEFIRANGTRVTLEGLQRHLTNTLSGLHSLGGRNDVAIIEDLVVAHPQFGPYSFEGVPDIRLIVFLGYPVMGMLRLATHASNGKANLHQGAVGVGLDIATGSSVAAVQFNELVYRHPDTGAQLNQINVPNWKQLLTLAAQCYEVTQLGYLGCDIVIDSNKGPLILELNARPGLSIQIANNAGLVSRLRRIEKLEIFNQTVEQRVEFAMHEFATSGTASQAPLFESEPEMTETESAA